MVGHRLDASPWNLGVPFAVLAACGSFACGPIVAVGDTDTGSATDDPTATTNGPSTMTSPTSPGTTMNPTVPGGCIDDRDCPANYRCDNGSCYYQGYCTDYDCCYDTCCGAECGWYDQCFYTADCAPGEQCRYNDCNVIPSEDACVSVPFAIAFDIPTGSEVYSLAFVESDGNVERELLIGGNGVALARIDGTSTVIDASSVAFDMDVRDLDGDGDGDVVIANVDTGVPRVLYNDGAWTSFDLAPGGYAEVVATADINGDGYPDVIGSSGIEGLYVWYNQGPGGWTEPAFLGDGGVSVGAGPLDGDSAEDFVVSGSWVAVWSGAASQISELSNGTSGYGRPIAVGNFDGAGDHDVIMLEPTGLGTAVTMWPGPVLQSAGWTSTWWPNSVEVHTVADVNLDGFDDLVGGGDTLTIGYGGSPGSPDTIVCVSSVATELPPRVIAVGDMSGDGRPDIAVSDGQAVQVMLRTD